MDEEAPPSDMLRGEGKDGHAADWHVASSRLMTIMVVYEDVVCILCLYQLDAW